MSTDTVRGRGRGGTVAEAETEAQTEEEAKAVPEAEAGTVAVAGTVWQAVLHFILFCPTKCPLIRSKQAEFVVLQGRGRERRYSVRDTYCISSMCGTCDRSNS